MSEQTNLPAVTQVTVTAQINIALTQQSISVQKIQDEINKIVFNEDNLPRISELMVLLKKADKVVEDNHKQIKAPFLEGGKTIDAAKNSLLAINAGLMKQLSEPYNKLCADIEKRKQGAEKERLRVKAIKEGIENNCISFSSQIAQCETNEQLLSVERSINLEKSESRKNKYMEFHADAISAYESILLPILKGQKDKIKQKDALKSQIEQAENENNAAKLDELKDAEAKIDNEILQNQVDVQQNALNDTFYFEIPVAEEVLPDINTVNRIKFEIVDLSVAAKKCPELLDVSIKHRDAQKVAMTLKEAGTFKDKSEVVVNGIKFFIDKTYKP